MAYFLLSRSTLLVGTLWVTILIAGLPACSTLHPQPSPASPSPTSSIKQPAFFNTPLHFEANEGQTDRQVKFLSRGSGYGLYLTPQEAVLALRKPKPSGSEQETEETSPDSAVLRMRLVGANATPELTGDNLLPGKVNYFIGNDPAKWRTQIPTYGKIRYDNVYPGIDLLYYGNQRQLEYDFIVAPGEDPAQIAMAFEGADRLEIDAQTGDLVLQTASGEVRQHKPLIYQEGEGARQTIEGQYVIKDDIHVGFHVATYDTTQPLIIDPVLRFSTYLGGTQNDGGLDITVDERGRVYLIGNTGSANFPTQNSLQLSSGGGVDAFVVRLKETGTALDFATYLGGSGDDEGKGIAFSSPAIYLTGITSSTNFPTQNPLQPTKAGGRDAFVVSLSMDGSALSYSTYLGGSGDDVGQAIGVDSDRQASVVGTTSSRDFPTQNPFQASHGGGFSDVFVARLSTDGSALEYATYLGGSGGDDQGMGILVSGGGILQGPIITTITGFTDSTDFPTREAFQPTNGGMRDAFVAQLTQDGSDLAFSTYLGGSGSDTGHGLVVDGSPYVVGETSSPDFPVQNPLQQSVFSGAFVTKFVNNLEKLEFSTFIGGGARAWDITKVRNGPENFIYVTGETASPDFQTEIPFQPDLAGGFDAFVAKIDSQRENLNERFSPLGPDDVSTAFSSVPCDGAYAGTFTITAKFTNTSAYTLSDLLLTVQSLTGGNVLCNADGGPGGVGSQLSIPVEVLGPGEAFIIELPIGLQSFSPFQFLVNVLGVQVTCPCAGLQSADTVWAESYVTLSCTEEFIQGPGLEYSLTTILNSSVASVAPLTVEGDFGGSFFYGGSCSVGQTTRDLASGEEFEACQHSLRRIATNDGVFCTFQ